MLRSKRFGKVMATMLLSVVMVLLCFANGCSQAAEVEELTEQAQVREVVSFLSENGYDIVLCLDESDSITKEGVQIRNQAAKTLVHMLTHDCRLAIGYFSKIVNYKEALISVGVDGVQEQLLEILNRNVRKNNGTNLNLALEWALETHNNDSSNQKAIIIMTDGTNYVSTKDNGHGKKDEKMTENTDELLRQTVARAATADNGSPVPVYVVYIEESVAESKKDELCALFSADEVQAENLDVAALAGGSVNKIVIAQSMDDLGEVFAGIFSSLKNIGYKSFESTESGLVSLSVPEIGATKVRVYAESDEPFMLSGIFSVVDGKSVPIYIGEGEADDLPEVVVIEPDSGKKRIESGDWQVQFDAQSEVRGAYSIITDFDAEITFTQQGGEKICCDQPVSAEVRLIDSDGQILRGGKKTTVSLMTDCEYALHYDDGAYKADNISFSGSGTRPYFVQVKYDEVLFSARGDVEILPVPDLVEMDIVPEGSTAKDGFFVLGSLKDFTSELDENKPVEITVCELVESPKDKRLNVDCKVENGIVMIPDFGRDVFTVEIRYTDTNGVEKLTRLHVDGSGKTPEERREKKMTDNIILFTAILTALAMVFIIPLIAHCNAVRSLRGKGSKQLYDVRIEETRSKGDSTTVRVGYLNAMNSATIGFNSAIRNVSEMSFPSIGGLRCGGEDIPVGDTGFRLLMDDTYPDPVIYLDGHLPVFSFFGKKIPLRPGSLPAVCYHKLVFFFKTLFSSSDASRSRPYAFRYKVRTGTDLCRTVDEKQYCIPLELSKGYTYIIKPEYVSGQNEKVSEYCISGRKTDFHEWK